MRRPSRRARHEANGQLGAEGFRGADDLAWTYISPASILEPGGRTGEYRTGGVQVVMNDPGESRISAEDYAVALADVLEQGTNVCERITLGY